MSDSFGLHPSSVAWSLRACFESKKTSFWFLVGRRHWWRDVRGRQQLERKREEQELINWGEGGAGNINQAEDRETREHGFEVTSAFLRAEFKFSTTTKLIFFLQNSQN